VTGYGFESVPFAIFVVADFLAVSGDPLGVRLDGNLAFGRTTLFSRFLPAFRAVNVFTGVCICPSCYLWSFWCCHICSVLSFRRVVSFFSAGLGVLRVSGTELVRRDDQLLFGGAVFLENARDVWLQNRRGFVIRT